MTRRKKILLWTAITAGVLAVLATALLVTAILIAPRVINLETVKSSIEAAVSRELGGTLVYERVDFVFFPPGVSVRNLTISVPGVLSSTIRSLEIYPSILPLFARRFEIARVMLDHPEVTLDLDQKPKAPERRKAAVQSITPQKTIETVLSFAASRMPDITIVSRMGNVIITQEGQTWSFRDIAGRLVFRADADQTPKNAGTDLAVSPSQGSFLLVGRVSCTAIDKTLFPAPLSLSIDRFEARPKTFTLVKARANLNDLSLDLSGKIDGYLTTVRMAELILRGSIGAETVQWIRNTAHLPTDLTIHAPLLISQTHLRWHNNGTTVLQGSASVPAGPVITFDFYRENDLFRLNELRIKDRDSDANLTLDIGREVLGLGFTGSLAQTTLNRLFEYPNFRFGWVKGDFHAHILYDDPLQSTAEGFIAGEGLVIPLLLKIPFTVDFLTLRAEGRQIMLNTAVLNIAASKVAVQGNVALEEDGIRLDLDLSTDGMEWAALRELLAPSAKEHPRPIPLKVLGAIRLRAGYLATENYTFRAVDADVSLEQDLVRLSARTASVCGISLPGTVVITPQETQIDLLPSATGLDLTTDLACLTGGKLRISGSYIFIGKITARGPKEGLLNTLGGTLALTAKKGKVYHDLVFIRTIAYLNLSDLLRGRYDNIEKDGVPYDSFTAVAEIRNGTMTFKEAVLKSDVMNIVARGNLDLPKGTIDITLLAAPFTTVDAVVKRIPLLGEILGGNLVSIPIRIHGPLDNPDTTTLPVSSIGEGLLGMMKRTLTLPFTIIEPILPKGKPQSGEEQPK